MDLVGGGLGADVGGGGGAIGGDDMDGGTGGAVLEGFLDVIGGGGGLPPGNGGGALDGITSWDDCVERKGISEKGRGTGFAGALRRLATKGLVDCGGEDSVVIG